MHFKFTPLGILLRTAIFLNADKGDNPPAPAVAEKPKTLAQAGERITALEGEVAAEKQKVADAEACAAKAEADHKQAASQLEAAIEAGKSANEARDKALADLGAANATIGTLNTEIAAVKGDLSKANTNVSRLEGLCGVKGIDPKGAIPSESADASVADEQAFTTWQSLSGREKSAYGKENKEAIDRYAKANGSKKLS